MNEQIIAVVLIALIVFVIAAIVIGIINALRLNSLLEYSEDGSLVESLKKYYENIRDLQKKLKISSEGSMSDRISACETKINMSLSKTGIVNFNAFDDVHGNQSFALAVLNQYNDGFVITSLYGSSSSNTYVRVVRDGKSVTKLLDEEREAIRKAMSGNVG